MGRQEYSKNSYAISNMKESKKSSVDYWQLVIFAVFS